MATIASYVRFARHRFTRHLAATTDSAPVPDGLYHKTYWLIIRRVTQRVSPSPLFAGACRASAKSRWHEVKTVLSQTAWSGVRPPPRVGNERQRFDAVVRILSSAPNAASECHGSRSRKNLAAPESLARRSSSDADHRLVDAARRRDYGFQRAPAFDFDSRTSWFLSAEGPKVQPGVTFFRCEFEERKCRQIRPPATRLVMVATRRLPSIRPSRRRSISLPGARKI